MLSISLLLVGVFSGTLGTILGLGGGIFTLPILTLLLKLDFHTAISMSLAGIIAKSILSTAINIKNQLINVPLGLLLTPTAVIGSTIGGRLGLVSSDELLGISFSLVLVSMAILVYTRRHSNNIYYNPNGILNGTYKDQKAIVNYTPVRITWGIVICTIGGFLGGALGIGGGGLLVTAMKVINKIPIKIATATSLFVMGISSFPPTLIYFSRGILNPRNTIFMIVGAFTGTILGNLISKMLKDKNISKIFAVVLVINACLMIFNTL